MFKSNQPQFSPLFLVLACCFVVLLLLANIIAGKMANFFGITLPAAVILFPLTYIFGDVLTEVYGFSKARLIIWLGFSGFGLNPANCRRFLVGLFSRRVG
jgi:uncharacterized PurR-regulated membrane protein YhhQ (DUF165 family)